MTTDTTEKGLETLIIRHMTGLDGLSFLPQPSPVTANESGIGYFAGSPKTSTAPTPSTSLNSSPSSKPRNHRIPETRHGRPERPQGHQPPQVPRPPFLEITKCGVIEMLRKGIDHGPVTLDLFFGTPSEGNAKAAALQQTEPLLYHPTTRLQHRRNPPRPRPLPLHQRTSHRHLRTKKQPHQANRRRRY